MNNAEINQVLARRRGAFHSEGDENTISDLMYFLLMDASWQAFDNFKKSAMMTAKQEKKRIIKKTDDAYHLFFHDFFTAFNIDQADFILDKTDEYESFIAHHIAIAEIAFQEIDNTESAETQKELSSLWIANFLSGFAQEMHGYCWCGRARSKSGVTIRTFPIQNRYIETVTANTKRLVLFYPDVAIKDERTYNRVISSVKAIRNKTVEWVNNDYESETKGL